MRIADILARRRPTMSLEFFPPKTPPGWERLFRTIGKFESLSPDFVSVTYGAGGSTREQTHKLVRRIRTGTSVEPVPHLTCVCHAREEVDAGADYICTQLFFDNRDYLDFRDRCAAAGMTIPVIAGIMPNVSRANYERIPSLALGSRYPAPLIRRLAPVHDDAEVRRIGVKWAQVQCEGLVRSGADGIHFYTLNRFEPIREVWAAIR